MALDHPAVVERLAVMDIVPTGEVWWRAVTQLANTYWHWPYLAQPGRHRGPTRGFLPGA